jgi:hypothetical protein
MSIATIELFLMAVLPLVGALVTIWIRLRKFGNTPQVRRGNYALFVIACITVSFIGIYLSRH